MKALALALLLVRASVLADDSRTALESSAPAPAKTALTEWHYQGTVTPGLWLTDEQARRIAAELKACDQAQPIIDRQGIPWWVWTVAGMAVGGLAAMKLK